MTSAIPSSLRIRRLIIPVLICLQKVIEYLSKKGYSKTEAMLRAESANQDVENTALGTRTAGPEGTRYGKGLSE